ncbi:MAG: Holliday junction branch migration protein RuvA [Simkaniaceae bacterium]|nr:Holliday junction branch migration protein RuvA [Candidatus Sacchlamyda saccharinae]
MFEYLKGTLIDATPSKITIDVNGVGYCLFISIATFEKLPNPNTEVKLYTSFIVREDSQKLFGFLTPNERDFFHTLCDISGIGPRLAIAILGHMTIEDLYEAVSHHNTKAISSIPGIGKKMAERLILELQGKFETTSKEKVYSAKGPLADAISALINLGYNPMDAQKAVQMAAKQAQDPPLAELISLALKAKK